MKHLVIVEFTTVLIATTGCICHGNKKDTTDTATPVSYTMYGRYEDCGLIFDQYGEVWEYHQSGVNDHTNVRVYMNDNGTPDANKDDVVLHIVEDSTIEGDASLLFLNQ